MFELTEAQRLAERAIRQWCENELAPAVPDLESARTLPYDLLRRLGADLGLSAPLVAQAEHRIATLRGSAPDRARRENHGEFGDDPMLVSVLLKEISRVSPGFALTLISTLGCAMTIVGRGGADVIERCALPVLRFEKIGAWALTEPEAGSDAFGGMRTTAVVDVARDEVVLNGHKIFITNAPYAQVFTIYARIDGDIGVRPIVVERGTTGLETGPPMRKMGVHDSPTGEVFLNDCRVSAANVIGNVVPVDAPRGESALETLNLERAVMPAICLGIIERCVEESIRYARTRKQFGRPIADFQGISFKLARMELVLENARNLVFKLAWAQRTGQLTARLASLAKLYCAEHATAVALDAIQIHGGAGYMADLPLEKLMRDAKLFEIGGGTNEIQLQTIARAILA
jgi:alkylation response protein AidB-like acyl-CoA dehydrogenase